MHVSDATVMAFIEGLPRHLTYTEMEAACAKRFGPAWGWSRDKLIRHWKALHPVRKGRPSRLDIDATARAFVEDRLGRLTLDEIASACREAFGEKAPSRSAIHRHWKKWRERV